MVASLLCPASCNQISSECCTTVSLQTETDRQVRQCGAQVLVSLYVVGLQVPGEDLVCVRPCQDAVNLHAIEDVDKDRGDNVQLLLG